MSYIVWCAVLLGLIASGPVISQSAVKSASGHHYSYLEGAQIGHDFGRNPFAQRSSDAASLGFDTSFGRSRLRSAMAAAVSAGETRMTFDLAFDFRSLVRFESGLAVELDDWAIRNVTAFLSELTDANGSAKQLGRFFFADVVLVDHAVADGVAHEGAFTVGEHPELIVDRVARQQMLVVIQPVLSKLVAHPNVTINLMNEPEFISLSALEAARMFRRRSFRDVALVPSRYSANKIPATGHEILRILQASDPDARFQVRRAGRKVTLTQTAITSSDVTDFLVDLWLAVVDASALVGDFDDSGQVDFSDFLVFADCFGTDTASPDWNVACDLEANGSIDFSDFVLFAGAFGRTDRRPEVTIGWADDLSALENTPLLERAAGDVVTDVLSFHVYDVPENRFHPLSTRRNDFEAAGYGDRTIRITEWGLGHITSGEIAAAMSTVLEQTSAAGFEGVIFWWDNQHVFDHASFEAACK
jgi:hypothetical protein